MTGGGTVFTWLATIWAGLAVPTLVGCLTRWDPLERAGGRAVGPRISSRWGWFLMEIPALATFPGIYLASSHHHPVGNLVVIMWIAHTPLTMLKRMPEPQIISGMVRLRRCTLARSQPGVDRACTA